jgi:hypothetical protein
MAQHTDLIAGRHRELQEALSCIRKKGKLHIHGPEGVGKSALLDWLYDNWGELNLSSMPIYCRSSRTLRGILLCMSTFLLGHFNNMESVDKFRRVKKITCLPDIKKLNIRTLRNLVFSYITHDNFCLLLDHLEYGTPKINGFLSVLYEKATVITASRQSWDLSDYQFKGNLGYCLYLTPKLEIPNLSRQAAYALMERLWNAFKMELTNKSGLFREVLLVTHGNPKMIVEIMSRAGKKQYVKDGVSNLKLLQLDMMMEKLPQSQSHKVGMMRP